MDSSPFRPASVPQRTESEQTDYQLKEGTQYFYRMRFLFLSCRLIQCIAASMIVFYPKSAFSQSPGTSDQLKAISDSEVLTHYGFNMGIATAALIHNLICYMVYLTNRATLPFIIYTALTDFLISDGFLGLFLAAILVGGVGLSTFYRVLCILAWLPFLVTSIMEISLVFVFNHLQNELASSIAPRPTQQISLGNQQASSIQQPIPVAMREKTPHPRRHGRNVTMESVDDSMDVARNYGSQGGLSLRTVMRRQTPPDLSQATTVAEILGETVDGIRPNNA